MNAIILSVGDELTSGQTLDTNSAHLARELGYLGVQTLSHCTVADRQEDIVRAIRQAADQADLVVVSGGLGPTADDLSRQALAEVLGSELVLDEACLAEIEAFFSLRGRKMNAVNRVQAMVPAGARPLANRVGTAPGLTARVGRATVFIVPGVPHEMRWMFANCIAPTISGGDGCLLHRVIHTFGAGESDVAAAIADLMKRSGPLTVGTTVAAGLVSVRITSCGQTCQQATSQADEAAGEIRRRLGELVVGDGEQTVADALGELLRRRGQTLATAESCTGGMMGEMLTASSGASEFYVGGVVAYDNRVKARVLGVGEDLLAAYGAVSAPVAEAMAENCRRVVGSDWALSVTGIAGPTGGTADKPVGLVFLGLAGPNVVRSTRHVLAGDRQFVRLRSCLSAMNELRLLLSHA